MPTQVIYKTIDDTALTQRLDNYLIKNLKGVPKSHIYQIIRKGNVRVNKGRKKATYKLQLGDVVRIPPIRLTDKKDLTVSTSLSDILKQSVLYEDKGLLIINKPSGLASHSGSGISIGVIEAMRQIYGANLELVHRLDRATSGCLLIAKKRSVLKNLQQQLVAGDIHKRYWALLKNTWQKKQHTISAPLIKKTQERNKVTISNNGVAALSYFQPMKNIKRDDLSLSSVEVVIKTGRTHQIRVHAKYAGHQVVGDDKYGDDELNKKMAKLGINRLCLHAMGLKFYNPTTAQEQSIVAPLDAKLQNIIAKL